MPSREQIIAKAADDREFRDKLMSDPKGTLEAELGTTLPDDLKISVLEQTANQVYLVVPANGSKELSSSELSGVAGAYMAEYQIQLAATFAEMSSPKYSEQSVMTGVPGGAT